MSKKYVESEVINIGICLFVITQIFALLSDRFFALVPKCTLVLCASL